MAMVPALFPMNYGYTTLAQDPEGLSWAPADDDGGSEDWPLAEFLAPSSPLTVEAPKLSPARSATATARQSHGRDGNGARLTTIGRSPRLNRFAVICLVTIGNSQPHRVSAVCPNEYDIVARAAIAGTRVSGYSTTGAFTP